MTKLVRASGPRSLIAALSYTIAASSAVSYVPSQRRTRLAGSLISAAHFPHGRCRTPRNFRPFVGAATFIGLRQGAISPAPAPLLRPATGAMLLDTVAMLISFVYLFTRWRLKSSSSSSLEESVASGSVTDIRTTLGTPEFCSGGLRLCLVCLLVMLRCSVYLIGYNKLWSISNHASFPFTLDCHCTHYKHWNQRKNQKKETLKQIECEVAAEMRKRWSFFPLFLRPKKKNKDGWTKRRKREEEAWNAEKSKTWKGEIQR